MKTAARVLMSIAVAVIVNLCAFGLLSVVCCAVESLFSEAAAAARVSTISGCVLCYLPALLTGMIVGRVKGLFRPMVTAPLGVIAFWGLFLGFGAIGWPAAYWSGGQGGVVPWPFDYWTVAHCFPSLFVWLSTGFAAQLGVDWRFRPRHEAAWLLGLVALFSVAATLAVARYFFLPYLDHDEVEQTHVIWSLSHGIVPYRDLHQIHMPLLWMLAWPLMDWLPHTFDAVLSLRIACAAALIGSYVAGLLMLREILGTGSFFGHGRPKNVPVPLSEPKGTVPFLRPTTPGVVPAAKIGTVPALVLLLLVLSVAPAFQLYIFRTDPFMTLCSAWAVLAAVRMRRAPALYSFWCGLAFGLAASFSLRLSWLCFLVPLVCLCQCGRQRSLRPLWLVMPNGAGFVIGVLPVALWIVYHGVLPSFWSWVIVGNTGSIIRPSPWELLDMAFVNRLFTALALLGGAWLLWRQWHAPRQAWSPVNALVAGALLAWSVPLTNSFHLVRGDVYFAFQVITIPGAVLGTVFVARLLAWGARAWQLPFAVVVLLFVLIAAHKPVPDRLGDSATREDFQELSSLCAERNGACICFAPWHPIFCRDAVDLYLRWDAGIAGSPLFSPVLREKYRQLWPAAIAAIEKGSPSVVADYNVWEWAHRIGVIDDQQYARYQHAVERLYDRMNVQGRPVYTLKEDPASRAKSAVKTMDLPLQGGE